MIKIIEWILLKIGLRSSKSLNSNIDRRTQKNSLNRWQRLIKAVKTNKNVIEDALLREMERGLSTEEEWLKVEDERRFFNALVFHKKVSILDVFCKYLNQKAIRNQLHHQIPHLQKWASRDYSKESLLQSNNPEVMSWARNKKLFEPGVLRQAHLAEAIENEEMRRASSILSYAKKERINEDEIWVFLKAFGERKRSDQTDGLSAKSLEVFIELTGGWDIFIDLLNNAGVEYGNAAAWIRSFIEAMKDEILVDLEEIKELDSLSKKTKERILKLVALEAIKKNNTVLLTKIIQKLKVMNVLDWEEKHEEIPVKIDNYSHKIKLEKSVNMLEFSWISKAQNSQELIEKVSSMKLNSDQKNALAKMMAKSLKVHGLKYGNQKFNASFFQKEALKWEAALSETKKNESKINHSIK